MTALYQRVFDSWYQFAGGQTDMKIHERTGEWEEGGRSRNVHTNHLVTLEGHWEKRPFMLIFQDDPPHPARPGVEIFLSAMQLKGNLLIKNKTVLGSLFTTGRIKTRSDRLNQKIVCASPAGQPGPMSSLLDNPEAEGLLLQFPWERIKHLEVQDASGISVFLSPEAALQVSQEWVGEWLGLMAQLVLIC